MANELLQDFQNKQQCFKLGFWIDRGASTRRLDGDHALQLDLHDPHARDTRNRGQG